MRSYANAPELCGHWGFSFGGRIFGDVRMRFVSEGYIGCVGRFDGLRFEPNGYHWFLMTISCLNIPFAAQKEVSFFIITISVQIQTKSTKDGNVKTYDVTECL